MHVFTTVKIVPTTYGRNHNLHHNVLRHDDPVFQTVMTMSKLDEIKDKILHDYHPAVRITQVTGENEALVTLTYSPSHFTATKKTIREFVVWVEDMMKSALADYHRGTTSC